MGSYYTVMCVTCSLWYSVPCNSVGGLGWMTIYLNNTYVFSRHGIRVTFYAWYEKLLPGVLVLDAMITYDRSVGTREAFVQEAASFVSFSDPRVGSACPARGAPTPDKGPSAGSCKFVQSESAGRSGFDLRVSKKQPTGHSGLTRA